MPTHGMDEPNEDDNFRCNAKYQNFGFLVFSTIVSTSYMLKKYIPSVNKK